MQCDCSVCRPRAILYTVINVVGDGPAINLSYMQILDFFLHFVKAYITLDNSHAICEIGNLYKTSSHIGHHYTNKYGRVLRCNIILGKYIWICSFGL